MATPPPNVKAGSGDPANELVRHFLIEPTARGVRLKGCSNEPVFGEDSISFWSDLGVVFFSIFPVRCLLGVVFLSIQTVSCHLDVLVLPQIFFQKVKCVGIFNSHTGANNRLLTDSSQIWYASIFGQYLSIAANIFSKSKMCGHF